MASINDFINLANQAKLQCDNYHIGVACKASLVNSSNEKSTANCNSSLILLYNYYCQNAIRFESLQELFHNYQIFPRFISLLDLEKIWNSYESHLKSQTHFIASFMDKFIDLLILSSLHIFNNEGALRMFKRVNQNVTNIENLMNFMANLLHLHDENWIRNHIRDMKSSKQEVRKKWCKILSYDNNFPPIPKHVIRRLEETMPKSPIKSNITDKKSIIIDKNSGNKQKLKANLPLNIRNITNEYVLELSHFREKVVPSKPVFFDINLLESDSSKNSSRVNGNEGYDNDSSSSDDECIFTANTMSSQKLQLSFISSYRQHFHQFCWQNQEIKSTVVVNHKQPFVNLGYVSSSSRCIVYLTLTNNTGDIIDIDIATRNFSMVDELSIQTLPSSIIQGLSREIAIEFKINESVNYTNIPFIGICDIHIFPVRATTSHLIISLPIRYEIIKEK